MRSQDGRPLCHPVLCSQGLRVAARSVLPSPGFLPQRAFLDPDLPLSLTPHPLLKALLLLPCSADSCASQASTRCCSGTAVPTAPAALRLSGPASP